MKTVISWSPSFEESSSWNRFCWAHSNRRVSHTGSKINHREFGSFLWSTHTYGWSIWSGRNAVLIKITLLLCHTWQCWEYVPLPPSHQKEQADRRTVDVQSFSLIFSEGESEISLEKSLEEVKDSWKTKSWICSSLLPHNYLALSCVPFLLPSFLPSFLPSTSGSDFSHWTTERPAEPAKHNLSPEQ